MARDPRLAALGRALFTRRAGWRLAAALALLGILLGAQRLGWHRLTRAAGLVGHALAQGARLAFDAGWLLLLLAAAGVALGLILRIPERRTMVQRLPALATGLARWLLGGAALVAVLVLVVAVLPPRFTASRHFNTTAEELKAQNDVRTTLLQALAGALLAAGAYLTWRQLRVTREGQITDRYTRAVDQLGDQHLDVRLGGIYALERIARDSPPDRATIEEVLTAFVRGHAPWPPPPGAPAQETGAEQPRTTAVRLLPDGRPAATKDTADQPNGAVAEGQEPAADVQAALTVLGRRQPPLGDLRPLDLTRVDLRRAELAGADLQRARVDHANLQRARLDHANLQRARLDHADLQRAVLLGTDLQDAWLGNANLRGAILTSANLRGADLQHADLQGAQLHHANLQGAQLSGADLQDAWLAGVDLQRAQLGYVNLQDARLASANLQGAWLPDARLQGAQLEDADLQGARLERAELQRAWLAGANLQRAWLPGANLQGAVLDHANLRDADLGGANLQDARLEDANLQGADLRFAKLRDAVLASTNLQGTILVNANLQHAGLAGANLWDARLASADLQDATADNATRWPEGWTREQAEDRGVQWVD